MTEKIKHSRYLKLSACVLALILLTMLIAATSRLTSAASPNTIDKSAAAGVSDLNPTAAAVSDQGVKGYPQPSTNATSAYTNQLPSTHVLCRAIDRADEPAPDNCGSYCKKASCICGNRGIELACPYPE
jgi:hypothetical protein